MVQSLIWVKRCIILINLRLFVLQASALSSKFVSVFFWNIIFFCKAKFEGSAIRWFGNPMVRHFDIAIATANNFNAVEGNKKQK